MSNARGNGVHRHPDRVTDPLEDIETRIQMGLDYDRWEAGAADADLTRIEIVETAAEQSIADERVLNAGRAS